MIFILAACGGKGAKVTKANLVILGGIASGIPGMTGGTKIFGYNTSTGDTINLTYSGQGSLTVPNGVWEFAAITWDGSTGNGTGQVMEGDTFCGVSNPIALFGGEVAIDITLSNLGCSDEFFGNSETKEVNGEPKIFRPFRCLTDKEVHDDDQACTPSVAESFQVQLPDGPFGGPGLTTRCIDADTPSGVPEMVDTGGELRIPIIGWFDNSFPIRVRLFDGAGCTGTSQDVEVINAYAGLSQPFAARIESGTAQGDGNPNDLRIHNDPCLHGDGTGPAPYLASSEYIICTEAQFEGASGIEANLAGTYQLNRDLDFSLLGPFATSLVSGTFTGQLHGNNHSISNITFVATNRPSLGVFDHINGSAGTTSVEDLTLANIDIDVTDSSAVGALAGYLSPDTLITGIQGKSIDIDLTRSAGSYSGVGGLFGISNVATAGTPIQIHATQLNDVTITVDDQYSNVGGIFGKMNSGSYLRISKVSSISIQPKAGGEIGNNLGGAVGSISTQDTEIYGVVVEGLSIGTAGLRFSTTYNYIGGVVGEAQNSRVIDSKSTGSIYASGNGIGGFAGSLSVNNASAPIIDGNISNVYVNHDSGINAGGFVGDIYNATPSATITLENNRSLAPIDCVTDCGGFAGRAFLNDATGTIDIKKSYSKSDVSSSSGLTTANVGGFIGFVNNNIAGTLNITESFSEADVLAPSAGKVGGFIGRSDKPTITDSFYRGTVTGTGADVGGLIGNSLTTTINRAFASGVLPAGKECIGQVVGGTLTDTFYESGSDSDADCPTGTGGYLTSAQIVDRSNLTNFVATTWDDIDSSTPVELNYAEKLKSVGESYTGSIFDPIILTTAAQWNAIGDTPEYMKKTFKLGADISFGGADCGSGFEPIGSNTNPFIGNLKGSNFYISDINCTDVGGSEALGLFRKMSFDTNYGMGQVEDFEIFGDSSGNALYIDNVSFSTSFGDVGTLVGTVTDSGSAGSTHDHRMAFKAYKVHVTNGSITQGGAFKAGGLIGSMYLTNQNSHVIRSSFQGTVSRSGSTTGTGGLFGVIGGGPLAGGNTRYLDFAVLTFNGDVLGTDGNAGGIVGELDHLHMEMAYAGSTLTSQIDSLNSAGGFVGLHRNGIIRTSFAKGDVTCSNTGCNAGGFAGHIDGNTTTPKSYGNYAESLSVSTSTAGGDSAGCFAGKLSVTPIVYNTYANCGTVTGSTASYFANGAFTLVDSGTQAKNTYASNSDEVITGADVIGYEDLYNPSVVSSSTELVSSDPWIHLEGDVPRLFWEIFPEYLGN
ncbi:MAG: hypothetical protein ACJAT2_001714 [Bacteriovoracaceae bacterium]|jgi:hypothetical protein